MGGHRPQTADDVCENCVHFKELMKPEGYKAGECRRYPPVFAPLNQGDGAWHERFPRVEAGNWCGEFLAIEQPQTESPQ